VEEEPDAPHAGLVMMSPPQSPPAVRWTYAVLAWLLVAALLAQFLFAGIGVFAGGGYGAHGANALVIAILMVLALAGSAVARRPWQTTALHGLLLVLLVVQGFLVTFPGPIAALHPLNGALILTLALPLAYRAWQAARQRPRRSEV
jgi:Family of unknown function (DUF6220)